MEQNLKQKIEYIIKNSVNTKGLPQSLKKHNLVGQVNEATKFLGDIPKKITERVYCIINDIFTPQLCSCGKERTFQDLISGYKRTCGNRLCASEVGKDKFKATSLERYGVDCPAKSLEERKKSSERHHNKSEEEKLAIKEKRKETFFLNNGTYNNTSHIFDSHIFVNWDEREKKSNITNIEKYGETHWMKTKEATILFTSEDFRKKVEQTSIDNFGETHWSKTKWGKILLSENSINTLEARRETCVIKYGVNHWMKSKEGKELINSPEFKEKIRLILLEKYGSENIGERRYKRKSYILPSGKEVKLQGYENLALDMILKTYSEDDLLLGYNIIKEIGHIKYNMNGKTRRYYPDIYIKSINKIIEIKSIWTFDVAKEKNLLKQQATVAKGHNHTIMILDGKGRILSEIEENVS